MFFKNQQIDKYQILDTIGTGGFGAVYLARDTFIDKQVAIKVPHKQGEDIEKLLREPKLLAALNHPNIVSVITADQKNGVFFIVMEYVEGQSLEKHLRSHGALPINIALQWFTKISEALAYAHKKGVLHRDVRPANVLISNDGIIKVADLGTSRYLLESPWASTRIGSPPYMAPEHFQGKATFQSDIYSMGILMYESLTGRLPFYNKDPRQLARIVGEGGAAPVHELNHDVPEDMSRVVARAMHRSLKVRYQTAEDLIHDLKKVQFHLQLGNSQELAHLIEERPETQRQNPAKAMTHYQHTRGEIPPQPAQQEPISRPVTQPRPSAQNRQAAPAKQPRKPVSTREISSLFCWNCSRPIQKRTRTCPNCNVSL